MPRGDKPEELRSGKRPLVLGVVLVVLLGVAVFFWKDAIFGSKEEARPERPRRRTPSSRTTTRTAPQTSKLTEEEKYNKVFQMEIALQELEVLAAVKPSASDLDVRLSDTIKALESFSRELGLTGNTRDGLSRSVDANKEWLCEQVFARAGELLSEYRFNSAKQLLADCVPSESAAASVPENSRSRSRARRTPTKTTAKQKCTNLAKSDLLRLGLEGQVCIWINRGTDELGLERVSIELDPPEESQYFVEHTAASATEAGANGSSGSLMRAPVRTQSSSATRSLSSRNRRSPAVQWTAKWGSASENLAYILAEQSLAENSGQPAEAAALYATARQLEEKCTSFETAGEADAALLARLSRRTIDEKKQGEVRGLINQCQYSKAESQARELLSESPGNPENWRWLVRCYLESCNTLPMAINRSDLLRGAEGAGQASKYEVLNSLLAVSLLWSERPEGIGGQDYRDLAGVRTSKLTEAGNYAGKYSGIVEWLRAESIDIALQDFRFRPFLAGEPIDLVDRQGVSYTIYGDHGPEGQPALIVARGVAASGESGVYLQMPDGWRYQLVNVYPPEYEDVFPNDMGVRSIAKPKVKAVTSLGQISTCSLAGQNTLPVINRISVLRCEQSSRKGDSEGSWTLSIPRSALSREQVSQESRRNTSSSRERPSPFIEVNFSSGSSPRSTSSGNGSRQGQSRPITCLVRSARAEFAYFNDDKGPYLIGANGRRFYSDGRGLLRAREESGLTWNIAVEDRACPRELQVQMDRYNRASSSSSSYGGGIQYGGAGRPNGGVSEKEQLTTASAAWWLGQIAGQNSKSGRQEQSGPVAGRWLETEGRRIVQVQGQMLESGPNGLSDEVFYSVDDAAELLKMAEGLYASSLDSWPTLGGQVYREINMERLGELIGQAGSQQKRTAAPGMTYGRPSRTTSRKSRGGAGQVYLDPEEEGYQALNSLHAKDYNGYLAISGDLIGIWSLRIQQGISEDVLGAVAKVQAIETMGDGAEDPTSLFGPDIESQALDKTTWITGRRSSTSRRSTSGDGTRRNVPTDERFFMDASMLEGDCRLRGAFLGREVGLLYQGRKAARYGELRVRCFFLAEFREWLEHRQGGRRTLPEELADIEQEWQKIVETPGSVGLQRSLQAAKGETMTVAWPELSAGAVSDDKKASGFLGSLFGSTKTSSSETQASKAMMTLEAWLDAENTERERLPGGQVLVNSQFDWGRAAISGAGRSLDEEKEIAEGEEIPSAAQRAERIVGLAGAYESTGKADAATAEALWQLGSYAASMGMIEEAQECLGQAGTAYVKLAEEAGAGSSGYGGQDVETLREYYRNRTAALLCLAQAGAVEESGGWPDNSVLLLGEVEAKISQLQRHWSEAVGDDSLSGSLQAALKVVATARKSRLERGYENPRMRFWWWYYPLKEQDARLAGGRQGTGSARGPQAMERPTLQYVPGAENQPGR